MLNFQRIRTQTNREIFKSALMYLQRSFQNQNQRYKLYDRRSPKKRHFFFLFLSRLKSSTKSFFFKIIALGFGLQFIFQQQFILVT